METAQLMPALANGQDWVSACALAPLTKNTRCLAGGGKSDDCVNGGGGGGV